MKKLSALLCLLLCAALLCPTAASAVGEPADEADVYAVVSLTQGGSMIVEDAPDADVMEVADSYELYVEDEPVLSVTQGVSAPASGTGGERFYTVEFMLPDTTKQVLLAGLSADKVEEIQERLIAEYASGSFFLIEDMSFIDAEKTWLTDDNDNNLCWAATASNMLHYAGWGEQAGFGSEDDVFDAFVASFSDYGAYVFETGFAWFFNGINLWKYYPRIAQPYDGTGAYLTDYAFDMLGNTYGPWSDGVLRTAQELYAALKNGYAAGLSVGLRMQNDLSYISNHAITCWGYVADTAYDEDDLSYYAGLFVTDSDTDMQGSRRGAPNVLKAVATYPSYALEGGYLTLSFAYSELSDADITGVSVLAPYTADTPKETDSAATRNKITTVDFYAGGLYLDTDLNSEDYTTKTLIESEQPFFYWPVVYNMAEVAFGSLAQFGSTLHMDITFTNEDHQVVFSKAYDHYVDYMGRGNTLYNSKSLTCPGLPEGDYTVKVKVNGSHSVSEAYYYNNEYTTHLKVRDMYLLGDFDGNGKVTILDATHIQRYLVRSEELKGENALLRGDIEGNGLNVLDATLIQRYLAGFTVRYPMGEIRMRD